MERSIADILKDDGRRGVQRDMPREAYHELGRMNASSLKPGLIDAFEIDPTLIRAAYEQTRAEPSAALQDAYDRGSLTHLLVFEPEKIVDKVAVWKGSRRAGGEWDTFEAENAGRLIMREADVREVQRAVRELRRIPQVRELLGRRHEAELAVLGQIGRTYCKGLIDSITTDGGPVTLIDLKTTAKGIDEQSVLRTIRQLGYREQLAFYAELYEQAAGVPVDAVYLLFVSLEPIGVRLVKLTTASMQWGLARMRTALEAVEKCIDAAEWPVFFGESFVDVSPWEISDEFEMGEM